MVAPATSLGCGDYEAVIQPRGGGNPLVASIPWRSLNWGRVLDDTSEARLTVDLDCCELADVRPWRHELALYRDGALVWVGPVFSGATPTDESPRLELVARDLTAWWDHRVLHFAHEYAVPVDLAEIFEAFSFDAMSPDNSPGVFVVTTPTGILGVRNILPLQHQQAGQALRDLANTGVDYTAVGRTILAGGLTIPAGILSLLTDDDFVNLPRPNRDGAGQANRWIVRGAGGGALGDTIFGTATDGTAASLDGLLESVASVSSIEDAESAAAEAASRVALTAEVLAVEDMTLAPTAPVTVDELIPGAAVPLGLSETCPPVIGTYRLRGVAVAADESGAENVVLQVQPLGTEELEG